MRKMKEDKSRKGGTRGKGDRGGGKELGGHEQAAVTIDAVCVCEVNRKVGRVGDYCAGYQYAAR